MGRAGVGDFCLSTQFRSTAANAEKGARPASVADYDLDDGRLAVLLRELHLQHAGWHVTYLEDLSAVQE